MNFSRPILFCASLLFSSLSVAKDAPAPSSSSKTAATVKILHQIFDDAWEYSLTQFPENATWLGDQRNAGQWDKLSLTDFDARRQKAREILKKLTEIDREQLPADEKLNFDLFDKLLTSQIESSLLGLQFLQINPRSGLQTDDHLSDGMTFSTVADYEAWVSRLKTFAAHAAQVTELLREGMKQKILYPKIVMQRIGPQIEHQIVNSPKNSPFYRPFTKFPDSVPVIDQARLAGAAEEAIAGGVIPAFQSFKKFFEKEYLPACPVKTGFSELPNGREIYTYLVRQETSTDLTPEKIHEIGLEEVRRLRAEMEIAKAKAGYKGSLADFFKFLRTDPKFFCKTSAELLQRYRATAKQIDPLMVTLFGTLPRLPYGVEPIPDAIAPDAATAFYRQGNASGTRAGIFFANVYQPETRAVWEILPLVLHEAVPGHHLQISLAMEQQSLPNFRRHANYDAYTEGWGLYAETLGYDLDLYGDPYDKFGQLSYEMWRAVRLVVDTGLHSMNWDRQKAIDYFRSNTSRSPQDIENEVDRYLSMPAQALSYKLGQMKITQLRDEAQLTLGKKFDLREYHDFVLNLGAVPLDILEREVKAWLAAQAKEDNISTIPR